MSLWTKSAALAAGATLGTVLALSATPASADAAGGVVHGVGTWRDDWSDEGPISANSYAYSNTAAMWQAILWADKSLKPNGKPMDLSDIDCRFGEQTTYTTKRWQNRYGGNLEVDGIVGPATLTEAIDKVDWNGGGEYELVYTGTYGPSWTDERTGRYVSFVRAADGRWGMYLGNELKTLWYKDATFSQCT
ncbi:peptidoglycan-binding protein [Streptomyces sp. NPDC018029]|uniref:peptidoglycan-binding protein n=1 Tax=Streptomyces sp. NPDC018029 TaxID=3365032 RepID=UPI0037895005